MMIALLILFAMLQVLDIWTTLRAFARNPTVYEANPLLRWLMRHIGPLPALIAAKLLTGAVVVWMGLSYPREVIAMAIVGVICAVYIAVVINNWRKV